MSKGRLSLKGVSHHPLHPIQSPTHPIDLPPGEKTDGETGGGREGEGGREMTIMTTTTTTMMMMMMMMMMILY